MLRHHHPRPLQPLQFQHHLCQPLLQCCNQHLVSEGEARVREGRQRLEQLSTRLPWQEFLMLQLVEMLHDLLLLSPLLLRQGLHSDDLFVTSVGRREMPSISFLNLDGNPPSPPPINPWIPCMDNCNIPDDHCEDCYRCIALCVKHHGCTCDEDQMASDRWCKQWLQQNK